MNEQTYSDVDVLFDAVNTLGGLMIPVDKTDELAMPIARVRRNLMFLLDAIREAKNKEEEKKKEEAGDEKTVDGAEQDEPIVQEMEIVGGE